MKTVLSILTIVLVAGGNLYAADLGRLSSMDLVSSNAIQCMNTVAKSYKERTSANPVKLNFYAADNKGETLQNRMALANISSANNYLSMDMDGSAPIDWTRQADCRDAGKTANYYLLSLHESVKSRPDMPIVLNFVSNTHVAADIIGTGVGAKMAERGLAQVVFEYPGYGAALGATNAKSAIEDGVAAVRFLRAQYPNRKIYLLGHSIGAGFSYEVAARIGEELAGVLIYGGIKSVMRQVEDQQGVGPDFVSKFVLWVLSGDGELLDFEKAVDRILARNPKLKFAILHGRNDYSVPPGHVDGVWNSINQVLKSRVSPAAQKNFYVEILNDIGHENVNFPADQRKFDRIWSIYSDFIYRLN